VTEGLRNRRSVSLICPTEFQFAEPKPWEILEKRGKSWNPWKAATGLIPP
jgi:hypothetical protein